MQGLDTHDAYEKLKESNFNDKQARGIVNIVRQAVTGEVATKADFGEVKAELKADLAETKADIVRLDAKLDVKIEEVRTEIADLRTETKTDIAQLSARIETVRTDLAKQHNRMILWVIGVIPAVVGAVKPLDYFFWILIGISERH